MFKDKKIKKNMKNITDRNLQLVSFLNKLSNSIIENKLSSTQLKSLGEFFMKYNFETDIQDNNDTFEYTEEDLKKFVSMGYYMYTQLMNEGE
jgi:hypothetical protein